MTSTFPVPAPSPFFRIIPNPDAEFDSRCSIRQWLGNGDILDSHVHCWRWLLDFVSVKRSARLTYLLAAVVFIDKLLPQHSSSKPFLERPSFIAATLALSSGVMIFSSLSALLPASLQRIDPDFLAYACFFGGVAFTLVITRIVHFFAPKAVHSCGATDHDDDHLHTPTTLKTPKNDIQTLKGPADSPGERERLLRYQNWDLEYGARNAAGYFDEMHHMHPRSAGSTLISEEADVEEDYFKLGIQTAIAIFVHKFPGTSHRLLFQK